MSEFEGRQWVDEDGDRWFELAPDRFWISFRGQDRAGAEKMRTMVPFSVSADILESHGGRFV